MKFKSIIGMVSLSSILLVQAIQGSFYCKQSIKSMGGFVVGTLVSFGHMKDTGGNGLPGNIMKVASKINDRNILECFDTIQKNMSLDKKIVLLEVKPEFLEQCPFVAQAGDNFIVTAPVEQLYQRLLPSCLIKTFLHELRHVQQFAGLKEQDLQGLGGSKFVCYLNDERAADKAAIDQIKCKICLEQWRDFNAAADGQGKSLNGYFSSKMIAEVMNKKPTVYCKAHANIPKQCVGIHNGSSFYRELGFEKCLNRRLSDYIPE